MTPTHRALHSTKTCVHKGSLSCWATAPMLQKKNTQLGGKGLSAPGPQETPTLPGCVLPKMHHQFPKTVRPAQVMRRCDKHLDGQSVTLGTSIWCTRHAIYLFILNKWI